MTKKLLRITLAFFAIAITLTTLFSTLVVSAEEVLTDTNSNKVSIPKVLNNSESPSALSKDDKGGTIPSSATQMSGSAGVETSYFPSPIPGNEKLGHSLLGLVHFEIENQGTRTEHRLDVTVGKYVDWGSSFFSPREFYSSYKLNGGETKVTVGRKVEFWSEVDKNWQLGLWQPQYKFEPLRPYEQGLLGFFYDQKVGSFEILAFASPIAIPTTGPDIKEQDGNLVSDSRWYQAPSQSGLVLGQNTRIIYSLSMPPITDLMNHPGSGIRFGWNVNAADGFWGSFNYGNKPINALLLKYDANLLVGTTASEVIVSPFVGYHEIDGVDFGYRSNVGNISLSFLEERPSQELPTNKNGSDWWMQQAGAAKIYAAHADTSMRVPMFLENIACALDYAKIEEKKTVDVDSTGAVRSAILPYRNLFTNAVSVSAKIPSAIRGKRIITSLRVLRDFDQRGNVYHAQLDLEYAKRWDVSLGVDSIMPDDVSESNTDSRFINQFRANDRFFGGVSYVF